MHINTYITHVYIPTWKCALTYTLTSLPSHIHMHRLSHTKIEPPHTWQLIQIDTQMHICIQSHTGVHSYTHKHTYTSMQIYLKTPTFAHMYPYNFIFTHSYVHACTCSHALQTHTNPYIHIRVYMPINTNNPNHTYIVLESDTCAHTQLHKPSWTHMLVHLLIHTPTLTCSLLFTDTQNSHMHIACTDSQLMHSDEGFRTPLLGQRAPELFAHFLLWF